MSAYLPNQWTIIKGNDAQILAHVLDIDKTPLNLSGATGVVLQFKKQDGTMLEKPATTGFSFGVLRPLFIYGFLLTAEETGLLPIGAGQLTQLKLSYGAVVTTVPIPKSLDVQNPAIS